MWTLSRSPRLLGECRVSSSPFNIWTLTPRLWYDLRAMLRPGMVTLECGSGLSTLLFEAAGCCHTALENDPRFAPPSPSVILRPLTGDPPWYDWVPPRTYDLILIDGPTGSIGRNGVLRVLGECLHEQSVVVIDDVHRPAENELARAIADRFGYPVVRLGRQRQYAVLRKPQRIHAWGVALVARGGTTSDMDRTLGSLPGAGWERCHAFIPPDSMPPASSHPVDVQCREGILNPWQTWLNAVAVLVEEAPNADAYLIVHAGAVLLEHLRRSLESKLWPRSHGMAACVVLNDKNRGESEATVETAALSLSGWAAACVLSPESARALILEAAHWRAETNALPRLYQWARATDRAICHRVCPAAPKAEGEAEPTDEKTGS